MLRTLLAAWTLTFLAATASGPVIALHPLELPTGIEDDAAVRNVLESAIGARLGAAGYTLVASRETGEIWNRRLQEAGGFYDPFTGDTLVAKYRQVHDGTLAELHERYGAKLWLRSRVEVLTVSWHRGKAEWDGTSEGVAPLGQGRVGAMTLVIAVEDSSGAVVAAGRGGLQVLAKVKGERYEAIPREKLFKDEKRTAKAADLALRPLLGGGERP